MDTVGNPKQERFRSLKSGPAPCCLTQTPTIVNSHKKTTLSPTLPFPKGQLIHPLHSADPQNPKPKKTKWAMASPRTHASPATPTRPPSLRTRSPTTAKATPSPTCHRGPSSTSPRRQLRWRRSRPSSLCPAPPSAPIWRRPRRCRRSTCSTR